MLGYASPRKMMREMSAREFRDWELLAEVEPFGQLHNDFLFASFLNLTYDCHRDTQKTRSLKLEDWVPSLKPEQDQLDHKTLARQQVERGRQWASLFRGAANRQEKRTERIKAANKAEAVTNG